MVEPSGEETNRLPLRKNRDFQVFWSSQVLSTLGTTATTIAFPLLVLLRTDSAAMAGLTGFAQTLPFLAWFLPAGALVDRWDRKRIMVLAEAARLVAMLSVVLAVATGNFSLWHILVVAFVEGTALVFFELAEAAALPHIVPSEQLPTAIAQNQGRQQVANLAGPPLGGVLFGIANSLPFAFDAVSYAISFFAIRSIRPDFQHKREDSGTTLLADIRHGIGWLWRNPFLRTISFLVAAWNFMIAALMLTLIVRAQELGASPGVVGLVSATFGLGAMGGVFFSARIQKYLDGRAIVLGATAIWAVCLLGLSQAGSALILGLIVTIGGSTAPSFQVMIGKYRYGLTPDELQGRMLSASRVIGWGAIPFGSMAAGFSISSLGPSDTMLGLAFVMAVAALASAVAPSLREDPLVEVPAP